MGGLAEATAWAGAGQLSPRFSVTAAVMSAAAARAQNRACHRFTGEQGRLLSVRHDSELLPGLCRSYLFEGMTGFLRAWRPTHAGKRR